MNTGTLSASSMGRSRKWKCTGHMPMLETATVVMPWWYAVVMVRGEAIAIISGIFDRSF